MSEYHISVLLQEVIDQLHPQPGARYIDATLGGGGHSIAILERGGIVLGIDQDPDALQDVEKQLDHKDSKVERKNETSSLKTSPYPSIRLVQGNFKDLAVLAKEAGFNPVSGIVYDLGVSSHQFDTPERGFSLIQTGPLDMRMDPTLAVSAKDLIHGLTQAELTELFAKLGEEPFAKKIAKAIVYARTHTPIETTDQLAEIVKNAVPKSSGGIHPATRVFQALRIAVNDELHSLRSSLPQALDLLENNGRIAVISFHSLEDRIVKQTFLSFEKEGKGIIITDKPIVPSSQEKEANRRSRSAKLRVFEKRV